MVLPKIPSPRSHVWSVADQALVSGTNFVCGILLARTLGLEGFGAYVIAQTYLLYANTFQSALVVSPMMTAVPAEESAAMRKRLLEGFFGFTMLVLVCTVVLVQAIAGALGAWSPAIGLGELFIPLGAAMMAFQIQDWSRRACYSESNNRRVFWADMLAYGGQLVAFASLAYFERLTPATALWSSAAAFSLSLCVTLLIAGLRPRFSTAIEIVKEHGKASRNFFASWQLQWLASQGVILFGSAFVGQQAAGAIRAAQNLLGPVNVLFQWMDNVFPVRAAVKYRDSGRGALGAYLWRIGGVGILALGSFAAVLTLVDEPLIVFLYGEEYRPFAILVVFQALYYLFGHAYRMASYFRRALGETRELAIASAWWALVALVVAFASVGTFADRGIMLALVLGEVAGLIYLLTRHRAERTTPGTHYVVRRADGSPYLLLPVASRRLMCGALSMYFPSRFTGKLYRQYLAWSIPLRARFSMVETIPGLGESYPHVDALMQRFPGLSADHCGVLVSVPGTRSKLTLRLMDAGGDVHAYARIAYGKEAIDIVRREAETLAIATSLLPAGSSPSLLWDAQFHEPDAYCLVESAGPEAAPVPVLGSAHFSALAALKMPAQIDWAPLLTKWGERMCDIVGSGPHSALCRKVATHFSAAPLPSCNTCLEHGDFAPWNIRVSATGALFLLDWEHSRQEGLPWMDVLHFTYQMAVLVRRDSPAKVASALLAVIDSADAHVYRASFPAPGLGPRMLAAAYLCRSIVEDFDAGSALSAAQQNTRLAVLNVVIGESEEIK